MAKGKKKKTMTSKQQKGGNKYTLEPINADLPEYESHQI